MSSSSLRLQSSPRLQISSLGLMKDMSVLSTRSVTKRDMTNEFSNEFGRIWAKKASSSNYIRLFFITFGVEGYEITLTRVIWFALEHRATSVNFGLTRICCGSSNQEPESWMIKWSINMQILSKVIKSIDDVGR